MGWVEFKFRIWIRKKSTNKVQTSNINSKFKRKDHVYELTLELKENLKLDNAKIIPKITMAYTYSVKANVKNYSYGNWH